MDEDMQSDMSLQLLSNVFERMNRSVISAIKSSLDIDLVNSRFGNLRKQWMTILTRYEKERQCTLDSQYDEIWISNIQETFESTEILRYQYDKSLQSDRKLHERKFDLQRNLQRLKGSRDVEKQILQNYKGILEQMVLQYDRSVKSKGIINGTYIEYKEQRQRVQSAHVDYLSDLKSGTDDTVLIGVEEEWLNNVLCGLNELDENVRTIIYGSNGPGTISNSEIKCGLKLEKIRLPSFNGQIRDYPRFRYDFENYVLPKVDEKDVPYVLKNCLVGEAHDLVKNVEDDTSIIWNRIEEKYGRPSKVVDEVIIDITSFPTLLDNDYNGFIKFVSVIETAMIDLKRVKLEKEIANSHVISEVEKRLPPIIRREWSYEVVTHDSKTGPTEKFASLLKFLREQRNGMEYLSSRVRCSPREKDLPAESSNVEDGFRCGHLDIISNEGEDRRIYRCGIHNTNEHHLGDCDTYKRANAHDKIRLVIKARACWNCLGSGHKAKYCFKSKNCTARGCTFWHHRSLHEAHSLGERFGPSE